MSEEIEFSEESLRRIAAQKVTFRHSVRIHALAYVLVNTVLFLLNVIFSPQTWWVLYPIFGWLIGLAMHALAYSLYAEGVESMSYRGVIYNAVAYIFTIMLLMVIDMMDSMTVEWAWIVAVCWVAGLTVHLAVHLIFFRATRTKKKPEKKISRKEKAIEKEMAQMRRKLKKQQEAL